MGMMPVNSVDYDFAYNVGQEAFHNGHPKVFPGGDCSTDTYCGWHDGWEAAWKATTEGEIKLGVYL